MCFNLAFSSIITRKLWSHHELHTHIHSPAYTSDMYNRIHNNKHQHIVEHTQTPTCKCTHIPPSWGITLQSQPLVLQGKTCFIISFHFFLLLPLTLPPSLPLLSRSATCSPPQTPVLKSQATSRALTAALRFWRCDSLCVYCVCV